MAVPDRISGQQKIGCLAENIVLNRAGFVTFFGLRIFSLTKPVQANMLEYYKISFYAIE